MRTEFRMEPNKHLVFVHWFLDMVTILIIVLSDLA